MTAIEFLANQDIAPSTLLVELLEKFSDINTMELRVQILEFEKKELTEKIKANEEANFKLIMKALNEQARNSRFEYDHLGKRNHYGGNS